MQCPVQIIEVMLTGSNPMFEKYDDIDEVFVLLSSPNRFILGANEQMKLDVVNEFTHFEGTHKLVDRYLDATISDNGYFKVVSKSFQEDYDKFLSLGFSYEDGLTNPNIRESTICKLNCSELNTHLEQRDFFKDIFVMDRIVQIMPFIVICPKMRERTFFPEKWDFYGPFQNNCCC